MIYPKYRNEADLGAAILKHERRQAFKTLRGKLPCDLRKGVTQINAQQRQIFRYINENGPSTSTDIAKKLRLNRISVSSHLSNLAMQSRPLINKMFTIRVPVKGKQKNGNKTKQLWVYGISADAKESV